MPKTKKKGRSQSGGAVVPANELLGVADDYLTTACMLTAYAKDATTRRGMERVSRALSFTAKVLNLLGGKVE